jgi:hypothetical protein
MFTVLFLKRLSEDDARLAITKPVSRDTSPIHFDENSIGLIIKKSGGYPYFIQFICKETFDIFLQQKAAGQKLRAPMESIMMKLDGDFFAARWGILSDRQRDLLTIIAHLKNCEDEFTVQEIVGETKNHQIAAFSRSQIVQMLAALINSGIIFKNRFGKYSFAVPQLNEFILRQDIAL